MNFGILSLRYCTTELAAFRVETGMVFQSFNLFPNMTVLENVMVGQKFVKGISKDAAALIARPFLAQVVVTHEMSYARDVADIVMFMADGRVVESGPARQVIEDPKEERTRDFLKHFHAGCS